MSKRLSPEELKARALRLAAEGAAERDARMAPPVKPALPQATPPPPATRQPSSTPTATALATPPAPRRREEDGEPGAAPDAPEAFGPELGGIVDSRKGLRARGWKPKNTLFHPREIAMGEAAARDWGLEWSELCNLALALIIDPSQRSESTNRMLADIQRRRS
jgi:hypothetical protein